MGKRFLILLAVLTLAIPPGARADDDRMSGTQPQRVQPVPRNGVRAPEAKHSSTEGKSLEVKEEEKKPKAEKKEVKDGI